MMDELKISEKNGTKKEIEIVEIESSIGTFLCGTWNDKCCLFEFKDRKSIDDILQRKSHYFTFKMASNKNPLHNEIELQITQYLEGKLIDFEIPLLLTGTDFQKKV
ncbi:MAG: hypothetical protein ACXAC2_08375, partial [Candidatus Kariarchaeaceae archaeon]